ncbi:uncharacterized protein [Haliotis cracherodii]|uniref:uncharacterized protein n=1 Tax=Haliotis cracherodii TaxID=6455 RepID=UPI0039ED6B57
MTCRLRCRPFCYCLFRILSTFFSLVGLAVCVFTLSFLQVRELSRVAGQDSRFDLSATPRPALNRHVCSPCLMERTNTTRNRRHCGNVLVKPSVSNNKRFEIKCENNESLSVLGDMPEDTSSFMLTFKDPCLKQYVTQHCYDQKKVPRIVHYVWFTKHAMDVYSFLSVLSASKFLNPCVIMFHADFLPFGPYWKNLMMNVKNIVFVRRQAPERIFGRRLGYIQHKSDIARIEALTEYGGIYLDCDQLVLKSFDDLRDYHFVMGHENAKNLGNSVMVSVPNAQFLSVWHGSYKTYNPRQWGIHSTFVPFRLAQDNPSLIHIENDTLINPDLGRIEDVYSGHFNWTNNYAIHLYTRWVKKSYTLSQFRTMDTAIGQIVRLILYGSPVLCSD